MTAHDARRRPIPVTLVTGFLGAGKTTLVNGLLRKAHGLRLAVLVNDFGAINIDAELIEGATKEVVSLKNGCICCSLSGGLLAAVSTILRSPEPPDAIIVESSGVTDPSEVARTLSDPGLQSFAPLDGIMTIVDATEYAGLDGHAGAIADRQIASADIVLLNKTDLAASATLDAAESRISALAPSVRVIRCVNAEVPLPVLMGIAGTHVAADFLCASVDEATPTAQDAFESLVIEPTRPLRIRRLHALLSTLPDRVYRVKGILHLAERPLTRCVLQATGSRASITIGRHWGDEPAGSRVVFIAAKGTLDRALIEMQLDEETREADGPEQLGRVAPDLSS